MDQESGSMMRVAITCGHLQRDIELHRHRIESHGLEIVLPDIPGQALTGNELISNMQNIAGVIAGDDQFSAEVLATLPQIKVISKWGVGLDGIDLSAAADLGVKVTNTPGMFGNEVAEQALGYLISLVRMQAQVDRAVRKGGWPHPVGRSLAALSACVLGLGDIGRNLTEKLCALGLTVVGVDPARKAQEWCSSQGIVYGELDKLISTVDILAVTCPLTSDTDGLVDSDLITKMRPGSWLINVGRGPVVQLDAVVRALDSGLLAGAALDVYEIEPLGEHQICDFDNVILGSHNASNTYEACQRTHEAAIDNLLTGLGIE